MQQEALSVQLAKSNWIKEHANISTTWKRFNADKYEALTKILDSVNPTYTAKRNKDDELILSTTIASGETIDVNVSELDDWEEFPMPEIQKLNEFYELAQNAGAQDRDLPAGTVFQLRNYLYNYIGKNKNALLSLMFDELPIGDSDNRMGFFTETELLKMFETDGIDGLSSEEMSVFGKKDTDYDFNNMRAKVIDKIVEKIKLENTNSRPAELGYYGIGTPTEKTAKSKFVRSRYGFDVFMADYKEKSTKEILNAIAKDKLFMGYILGLDGDKIMLKESSVDKSVSGAFDLNDEIKEFKKTGNAGKIFETLYLKTGSNLMLRAYGDDYMNYENLSEAERLKYVAQGL